MKKKKVMVVKDVLEMMDQKDNVNCILYAYGIPYGSTDRDGMKTVEDCLNNMNYDCLHAQVTRIAAANERTTADAKAYVVILGEIVH